MRNIKKAFGKPGDEFHFRVQQTLMGIEQAERPVARRRFSPALALCAGLCVALLMMGCFVAGARFGMSKGNVSGITPLAAGLSATAEPILPTPSPMVTIEPTAAPTTEPTPTQALASVTEEPAPEDAPRGNEMTLASAVDEAASADVDYSADESDTFTTVYATMNINGFFHFDPKCSECPIGAVAMPITDAILLEKDICPQCRQNALLTDAEVFVNIIDENVYHMDSQCKDLDGETVIGLKYTEALQFGMSACGMCAWDDPLCAIEPGKMVYHSADAEVTNGMVIPLAQALSMGYTPCPDCQPDGIQPLALQVIQAEESTAMYYGTKGGVYYHMDPNCSGMMNATLNQEIIWLQQGKEACPVCAAKSRNASEYDK